MTFVFLVLCGGVVGGSSGPKQNGNRSDV